MHHRDRRRGERQRRHRLRQLLAGRLQTMVTYLVDVKQQYADASGHLGLVDDVLGQLTFGTAADVEPGSDRDPDPYY